VLGGQPKQALSWLGNLTDFDASANLLRGKAALSLGQLQEARLRFERVGENGSAEEKADAAVSLIEGQSKVAGFDQRAALKTLDNLRFIWRGDEIEHRALTLGYAIANHVHDGVKALTYGATLLRYTTSPKDAAELLAACQAQLVAALADDSKMPLADAVGLFWNYRDLAPFGGQGDALLMQLAKRLADARLYERSADLLAYQMNNRSLDVEKGPVSELASRYYILAGKPDRAIRTLRASDQPMYPAEMRAARRRIEAVAYFQLGQVAQALAILDDMPDMASLRAEMLWRRRDWQGLVARLSGLPKGKTLTPVEQALVLREAVALSMIGKNAELAALRARYGASFAQTSSAAAFNLLTGPVDAMTSDGIARAMAAIPSASVAGEYEEMLNAQPAKEEKLAIASPVSAQKPVAGGHH
jgi:hypothetical protein